MRSVALCDRLPKFKPLYTTTLKTAAKVAFSTSDVRLFEVLRIHTLDQLAAHHLDGNSTRIMVRFGSLPRSVESMRVSLAPSVQEYEELPRYTVSHVFEVENTVEVDLLGLIPIYGKTLLGLVIGNLLDIRPNARDKILKKPVIKGYLECPLCKTAATQRHFLNTCPVSIESRAWLARVSLENCIINYNQIPDLYGFFLNFRGYTL